MFRSIRHALGVIGIGVVILIISFVIVRNAEQVSRPATEYVFFSYGENPDHNAISVINNGHTLPLTKEFDSWYHQDISPDCQSIVYTSQSYKHPGFFVAGLDGVKHWYVWDVIPTTSDGALMYPQYSPNGNHIAFTFSRNTGQVERTELSFGFVQSLKYEEGIILHSVTGNVGYDFHIIYRESENRYLDGLRWVNDNLIAFRSTEQSVSGLTKYYQIRISTGEKQEISGRDYSFLPGDDPQKSVPATKYPWTSEGSVCWTK